MLLEVSGDGRVLFLQSADSGVGFLNLLESVNENFFGDTEILKVLYFYCVEINYCLVVDLSIAIHELFHLRVNQQQRCQVFEDDFVWFANFFERVVYLLDFCSFYFIGFAIGYLLH